MYWTLGRYQGGLAMPSRWALMQRADHVSPIHPPGVRREQLGYLSLITTFTMSQSEEV